MTVDPRVKELAIEWVNRHGQVPFSDLHEKQVYVQRAMAITGSNDFEKVSVYELKRPPLFLRRSSHRRALTLFFFLFFYCFADAKATSSSDQGCWWT